MIKIIIRNKDAYKRLIEGSFFKSFIFFDLRKLHTISDENIFFKAITQLRMHNGIYKTTKANRFTDVNNEFVKILDKQTNYLIHDVAASDGITTVELFNKLDSDGIKAKIVLSDKFAKIYYEKKWYGSLFKDDEGRILFADFFKIQAYKYTSVRYFLTKLSGYFFQGNSPIKNSDKEILLLNPKTKKAIEEKNLEFIYLDVFKDTAEAGKYDIIRCMNILNLGVFPDEFIILGLKNLLSSLKDSGIFILGRSNETTFVNHVSFFRKNGNKLDLITELNGGSELKPLLEKLQ